MKHAQLILVYFFFVEALFAQSFTDPEYYLNGEIMKRSVYDSTTQKWKMTEYYRGGAIASEKVLEKDGRTFTDTFNVFYTNGKPVYKANYKRSALTGTFIQYYPNGKIRKQGEYYNFFKTGLWSEYYENGKKKSEGKYIITKKDSSIKDPTYLDDRIVMDTIIYSDVVEIDSAEKVVDGKLKYDIYVDSTQVRKDMLLSIPTLKDGVWQYWDEQGNLLREEKYAEGILNKLKK